VQRWRSKVPLLQRVMPQSLMLIQQVRRQALNIRRAEARWR
jgi:isoleucyl-tRNA synthetase